MKKSIAFLMCVLMLTLIAGCYNAGYYEEDKEQQPEKDSGELGEQGLLEILEEAEKEEAADEKPEADKEDLADEKPEADKEDMDKEKEEVAEGEPAEKEMKERPQQETTGGLTVTEGDFVEIKLSAYDPDGDKISYTYARPLNQEGKWQTKVGDEGTYKIDVTASDGTSKTTKTLTVRVLHKNRPPVIEPMKKIIVNEGDTINLAPRVRDPEGEDVKITFKGWMTEAKKKTGFDDAGSYDVEIIASDGELKDSITVKIDVLNVNRAPVFEASVN